MKYVVLIFLSIVVAEARSQFYFNKIYDFDGTNLRTNHATTSLELSNGDFLVAGNKFPPGNGSLHFIRIESDGDTIFAKRFSKEGCAYYTSIGSSLIKCFDGNLVQSGAFYDSVSSFPNALLVKLTQNGDTIWTKNYGGANFDNANIVHQTPDSGFVLMGVTQSYGAGGSDFYMIKTDSLGNFLWQQTYGTSGVEDCLSGQITLDGGFILSGHRSNQLHVVKTNSLGIFQWEKVYPGTTGQGFIKQLADSTFILVGAKSVSGLGTEAYISKLSKFGDTIWTSTYGGPGNQQLYAIPIILPDGSIICSGVSYATGDAYGLLLKTDSVGNQQWMRTYYSNPSNDNYVYDVKLTSDNGFIMTGSGNITGQDAWVVKVDSSGCEIASCNVGMEELQAAGYKLLVYPNPGSEMINVEISEGEMEDYEIRILNVLGQEIEIDNRQLTVDKKINISLLIDGIYFITATNKASGQRVSAKFIKK